MKNFEKFSDERFQQIFMHIISQSRRDNTYKLAFARFLLEYAQSETKTKVNFETIAKYFLESNHVSSFSKFESLNVDSI